MYAPLCILHTGDAVHRGTERTSNKYISAKVDHGEAAGGERGEAPAAEGARQAAGHTHHCRRRARGLSRHQRAPRVRPGVVLQLSTTCCLSWPGSQCTWRGIRNVARLSVVGQLQ